MNMHFVLFWINITYILLLYYISVMNCKTVSHLSFPFHYLAHAHVKCIVKMLRNSISVYWRIFQSLYCTQKSRSDNLELIIGLLLFDHLYYFRKIGFMLWVMILYTIIINYYYYYHVNVWNLNSIIIIIVRI